jgi:hypothetical protein
MYHATADDRGTVQALARDLDTAQEDGKILNSSQIEATTDVFQEVSISN